jgi:hypothetical protein
VAGYTVQVEKSAAAEEDITNLTQLIKHTTGRTGKVWSGIERADPDKTDRMGAI